MSVVFPARQERLDWQLVAEVDLASLLAGDTSQVIRAAFLSLITSSEHSGGKATSYPGGNRFLCPRE